MERLKEEIQESSYSDERFTVGNISCYTAVFDHATPFFLSLCGCHFNFILDIRHMAGIYYVMFGRYITLPR